MYDYIRIMVTQISFDVLIIHILLIVCVGAQSGSEVFRIMGSAEKPSEGSVQIYRSGNWRPARANDFSLKEAEIICHEAGYNSSKILYSLNSFHGPSRSDAIRFECGKIARQFSHCVVGDVANSNHKWDTAGVDCQPDILDIDVRLVNGVETNSDIGKVQVLVGGEWGGVCGGDWGNLSARVVCRQLGFENVHTFGVHFWSEKYTEIPFLMDNPVCYGNETNFGQCQSRPYTDTKCAKYYPYQSRGVACLSDEKIKQTFEVKMVPSSKNPMNDSGTLLVGVAGLWGLVCGDNMDFKTATVFCRHMGYVWGSPLEKTYFDDIYHVWISSIKCNGNETNIFECKNLEWITKRCYEDRKAAIRCFHTPHPEDPVMEKLSEGPQVDNGELTLRCSSRVKGTVPVILSWTCDPYYFRDGDFNQTHNVSTFTFKPLSQYLNRHSRYCLCSAYTGQGWRGKAYFKFDVQFGPMSRGRSLTDPGEVIEGEKLTVRCKVGESKPTPKILWYIGDVRIRHNISTTYTAVRKYDGYTGFISETNLTFIARRAHAGSLVKCVGWNNITERSYGQSFKLKMKSSLTPVANINVDKEDSGLILKFRCDTVNLTTTAPVLWMVDDVTVLSPIPNFTMKIPGHLLPGNYSCHIRTADGLQKIPAIMHTKDGQASQ